MTHLLFYLEFVRFSWVRIPVLSSHQENALKALLWRATETIWHQQVPRNYVISRWNMMRSCHFDGGPTGSSMILQNPPPPHFPSPWFQGHKLLQEAAVLQHPRPARCQQQHHLVQWEIQDVAVHEEGAAKGRGTWGVQDPTKEVPENGWCIVQNIGNSYSNGWFGARFGERKNRWKWMKGWK